MIHSISIILSLLVGIPKEFATAAKKISVPLIIPLISCCGHLIQYTYKFDFFAIRKKCLGLSNPTPDGSANSIISTNSSSVMASPSSKHTRCKSSKTTTPFFASSINSKALFDLVIWIDLSAANLKNMSASSASRDSSSKYLLTSSTPNHRN